MVMMGIELTGKSPFDTIYLHGESTKGTTRKQPNREKNAGTCSPSTAHDLDHLMLIVDPNLPL